MIASICPKNVERVLVCVCVSARGPQIDKHMHRDITAYHSVHSAAHHAFCGSRLVALRQSTTWYDCWGFDTLLMTTTTTTTTAPIPHITCTRYLLKILCRMKIVTCVSDCLSMCLCAHALLMLACTLWRHKNQKRNENIADSTNHILSLSHNHINTSDHHIRTGTCSSALCVDGETSNFCE